MYRKGTLKPQTQGSTIQKEEMDVLNWGYEFKSWLDVSENLCQCRACDEWISGDAHVCPKCGEMFQIFSCSECESDITENATECPSCGKKYILNLWFDRSYWILSIPFFIIVSAFILTIMYPLSDSTPISKWVGDLNEIHQSMKSHSLDFYATFWTSWQSIFNQ